MQCAGAVTNGTVDSSTPKWLALGSSSQQDPAVDEDRVVLPDAVGAPVMIRRRTLLERAAAADQLPRELAQRAARRRVLRITARCSVSIAHDPAPRLQHWTNTRIQLRSVLAHSGA